MNQTAIIEITLELFARFLNLRFKVGNHFKSRVISVLVFI